MSSELATIQAAPLGVLDVINNAVTSNASVEVLERLYALMERQNAAQAKRAFDEAMAGFQGECPVIEKSADGAQTRSGKVAYHYAPLDKIVTAVRGLLSKYGLSYSFDTINDDKLGTIEVVCIVKHIGGHSERSVVKFRLGAKTEIMSMTQQDAATVTYSKRYAFCNAFGIMTGDSDTDAQDITERSIFDEPGYRITTPDPQTNSGGPGYKPPAQRTPPDRGAELPDGVKHVSEAMPGKPATRAEIAKEATSGDSGEWLVVDGETFDFDDGGPKLGILYTLQDENGAQFKGKYWSFANAMERSGMAHPQMYRGMIAAKRQVRKPGSPYDLTSLRIISANTPGN